VADATPVAGPASPAPPASETPIDWLAAVPYALMAGAVGRLAWIAIGVVRLNALRRRSAGAIALGFDDLQAAIGTDAPILWSSDVRHPVTFGLIEPVVLLPAALKSVDHAAQRAVVAHELSHVKRRDWAWVLGEEIVRSIFWFHPAMWWLISRVQLARETVVDELSILVTNARRTYLDTLLAFADDTGLGSTPAFSARRHLFHRVMLLSKEGGMSSIRVAIASGLLIAALTAGTWTAVSAFPLHEETAQQQQAPPRDPLSPAAYHRQGVESFEKVLRDTSLTPEQKMDAILKGIAAEDRALALNPDYVEALIYKNILLRLQANLTAEPTERDALLRHADELRDKALTLRLGPPPPSPPPPPPVLVRKTPGALATQEMPPPPPPPPPPGMVIEVPEAYRVTLERLQPLRIGGGIKAPAKIKDVRPVYPPIAQAARVQGVVIVEAVIDADGRVADSRILRSIPLLDEAALRAVQEWEFTPTLLNGMPHSVVMTVTVNFRMQ
jgi:TonB family protein